MLKTKKFSLVTRCPKKQFHTPHLSQFTILKNALFIGGPPIVNDGALGGIEYYWEEMDL